MQKELQDALQTLSEKIQTFSALQISNTVQRAIRENVALSNEIEAAFHESLALSTKIKEYRSNNLILRLETKLAEEESKICLRGNLKQQKKISELSQEILDMNAFCTDIIRQNRTTQVYKELEEQSRERIGELEEKLTMKQEELKALENERRIMNEQTMEKQLEYSRLKDVLSRARNCLKEALGLLSKDEGDEGDIVGTADDDDEQEETRLYEDEYSTELFRQKLLFCLYEILSSESICAPASCDV